MPGPARLRGVAEAWVALSQQRERERESNEDYFIGRVAQCNQTLKSFIPWRDINHLKSVTV